jgi:hypothetical protein
MAYIGRTPTNAALTAADLADGIVSTAKIAADAVTDAKIADDVVGTEHLTANEVDTAALGADAVTGAQLADNAVNSEHYTDGSIDTAHIADNQITLAKLAGGTDGNIISFDASGDPVAIATGSDGQVLTSTGAGSPPAFEALPGGGKVLQVLTDTVTSEASTNNASFQATGLSIAITPSATSSKIYAMFTSIGRCDNSAAEGVYTIFKASTNLGHSSEGMCKIFNADNIKAGVCASILDSPNTTSATTYSVQMRSTHTNGNVYIAEGGATSTFTLFEIGA